jgi:hypothetical protein
MGADRVGPPAAKLALVLGQGPSGGRGGPIAGYCRCGRGARPSSDTTETADAVVLERVAIWWNRPFALKRNGEERT